MFLLSILQPGSEKYCRGGNWISSGTFQTEIGAVFAGLIASSRWMVTQPAEYNGLNMVCEGNPISDLLTV